MSADDNPFREYHRVRRRQSLIRSVATIVPIAAVAVLLGWAASAGGAEQPAAVSAGFSASPSASPSGDPTEFSTLPVEPAPAPSPSSSTTEPPGTAGARVWTIAIDTVGYQPELDQCLWVRMDLAAAAPIVGAHNYCGGSIVLQMAEGDTVTLSGTQLDGTYRVTGDREAHAGDNAAAATAGLEAAVILQTCYWGSGGRERLVSLQLV